MIRLARFLLRLGPVWASRLVAVVGVAIGAVLAYTDQRFALGVAVGIFVTVGVWHAHDRLRRPERL